MADKKKFRMVVGLGNPGPEYQHTRHNIGFHVLDSMHLDFQFEKKFKADIAKSYDCIYVKPQTFMNLSGEAVRAIADYYKIAAADSIVVYDDKDISFGTIRLRSGGSSAGHNGVQSIIDHLGTAEFPRVRIGIQQQEQRSHDAAAGFVLSNFAESEIVVLEEIAESAIGAIVYILDNGMSKQQHTDLHVEL
jgi:PTH1 family peptidyl-tRNA hydrolase